MNYLAAMLALVVGLVSTNAVAETIQLHCIPNEEARRSNVQPFDLVLSESQNLVLIKGKGQLIRARFSESQIEWANKEGDRFRLDRFTGRLYLSPVGFPFLETFECSRVTENRKF